MSDERLNNIEVKLAYQEHTIQELSDVVYQQQQQIDKLEVICKRQHQLINDISGSMPDKPQDERPPHY